MIMAVRMAPRFVGIQFDIAQIKSNKVTPGDGTRTKQGRKSIGKGEIEKHLH